MCFFNNRKTIMAGNRFRGPKKQKTIIKGNENNCINKQTRVIGEKKSKRVPA